VTFLPGRDVFAALDGDDEASGQREFEALVSEAPAAATDRTGRIPVADKSVHDASDTITFPHFEPELSDLDDDVPVAAFPTLSRFSEHEPRRRPSLLPGLLLALVLLQAIPSFLWLRNRFAPPSTSTAAVAEATAPAAPPALVAAPPEPAHPRSSDPPPPRPVGTASVASGKIAPASRAGSRPVAASGASRKAAPSMSTGLLSIVAPVPMQVYAKGRLIGTTGAKAIKLPVGNHDLDFVSEEVGYRASRRVAVRAARTTPVHHDAPTGMLSVNATPWAQVFIDSKLIGETPIGNFRTAIGQRQVMFRHPEFGEQRATVLVTLKQPARISVDFTKR
jgi:hypothetical protein